LQEPHFIIKGRLQLYIIQNGSKRELTTFGTGDITGYLPYSRAVVATATSHAIGELHLLSFPTERIREMIKDHFEGMDNFDIIEINAGEESKDINFCIGIWKMLDRFWRRPQKLADKPGRRRDKRYGRICRVYI